MAVRLRLVSGIRTSSSFRTTGLFQSLQFNNEEEEEEEREEDESSDTARWEKLYRDNTKEGTGSTSPTTTTQQPINTMESEIRVITFDLDNTLWKTSEVIGAANDALATHMESQGIDMPVRVEVLMGKLFNADKARYIPSAYYGTDANNGAESSSSLEGKAP